MLFPGYSIQRVFAGEDPYRLTVALQIATGNFGRRGGSTGAINSLLPAPRVGTLPVPSIEAQPSVPVVRWPDAILEGRSGGYPSDIHAIYNLGSNVLNQGGDIRKNMAAFEKLDFAVTHEVFLTPTARCCDVVFPPPPPSRKRISASPGWATTCSTSRRSCPPAGAGAQRLRRPVRPGRPAGLRRSLFGGPQRGRVD